MGLHNSTRMVSELSHHIVHLLDRQDKSNKNSLDQTSAATDHSTNVALTSWRVSTAADMMTKLPFFETCFCARRQVSKVENGVHLTLFQCTQNMDRKA